MSLPHPATRPQILPRPLRHRLCNHLAGVTAVVGLCTLAVLANAATATSPTTATSSTQPVSASSPLESVSETTPISPSVAPLANSFQPATAWPVMAGVSQTILQSSHDLLSYSGVRTQLQKLLGEDYNQWAAHFSGNTPPTLMEAGLIKSEGCLAPTCSMHKSLLIVSPTTQKVYAAMVADGRVSMWPSLMSWPDESISTIKDWLADSTDDPSATAPKPSAKLEPKN